MGICDLFLFFVPSNSIWKEYLKQTNKTTTFLFQVLIDVAEEEVIWVLYVW